MDRRESQCASRFGRNCRSHEEHLKYTLNQSKSNGDQIRGGEGMGWDTLEIAKQGRGEPQITLGSP
jgi:hypothetical protein